MFALSKLKTKKSFQEQTDQSNKSKFLL